MEKSEKESEKEEEGIVRGRKGGEYARHCKEEQDKCLQ